VVTNQTQGQPPDKGRAKRIAATSRVFLKAFSGLSRPGRKAKAKQPKQ
jgi:hypothetical protein